MARIKKARAVKSFLVLAGLLVSVWLLSASSSFAGSITVTDVGKSYGYTTAKINSAITACQASADKTLYFSGGTYVDTGNLTFPATITVQMGEGAVLQIASGITATFNGPFTAGLYRVFSGSGNAQFGVGSVKEVYPQWWGTGTGSDDSPAINTAIASSPASPGINVRLIGNFTCTSTINVNRNRANITGTGQYATMITFTGATAPTLFNVYNPADTNGDTPLVQCAIRDLALYGSGTNRKIGIKIVDVDIMEVRNVAIQNWTGNSSIGLQMQGRDFGSIENINVVADLPISIEDNPYCSIDIDHTTFNNTYLIAADSAGPSVKIASGVNLTNVVFQGTNAWVCGRYGLQWIDTASTGCSSNLSIKNVRYEQAASEGGEIIHIAHNCTLQNLVLENIYGGGKSGGIYLRNCLNATIQNIMYYSAGYTGNKPVALDIDASSSNLALINCWWQTGEIINTGTLIKTFGTNSSRTHSDNRLIEVYDAPNNPWGEGLVLYGTNTWCYSGTLAGNTAYYLPVIGPSNKAATVFVTASDSSGTNASGYFMVGGGYAGPTILVAGTNNMAATLTQGKLCLVAGNQVMLYNYIGTPLDIVITVFWR